MLGSTPHSAEARLCRALDEAIGMTTGTTARIVRLAEVGGGSISRSLVAEGDGRRWFVKLNRPERLDMFAAEADGLAALGRCPALRVPGVVATGMAEGSSFLVLEHVRLQPLTGKAGAERAGRALAEMHHIEGKQFGWHRDNFIGSTPQANAPCGDWPSFFASRRLLPQLELARAHGHGGLLIDGGRRLTEGLSAFLAQHRPLASLLHGDLWHGNAAVDESGKPVLFDPAVYYGDRETDLAMSELFGGFPPAFHAAYREAWPLAEGYAQRRQLYKLYHVLNHLNLFGGGYRHEAERMIGELLAELG